MPENPIYDPNKIVKRAYTRDSYTSGPEEQSSNGVPKYDSSKIVKKGYVPRQDFQEERFSPEKYTAQGVDEVDDSAKETEREVLLDYMIKNIPEGGSIRDDEKDILRGILKNPNATRDDMFNAIKTFKGVHPEQVYNRREPIRTTKEYYMDMDDKGIYKPVPIGQFKPLPAGKNIASVWGTGAEAQDDSWYTDLAKKAFNIIPSSIEGIENLISAVSPELRKIGAKLEGKKYEKSEPTKAAEESAKFIQQFKFPTSEEYNQQIYDAEGVKNFEDLISKDRVNLSLKNVYGTVSSLAGSVGEMLLTGGAAAEGMLATKAAMASKVKGVAPALTKAQKYASVYTGSFITNLGEAMDAAKKAGISEEDAGSFALAVTTPIAFLDAGLGIGGKILSNKLANEGKKELLENVASRVIKDEFGNITEESLKKASSEAVKAYTPVAKSLSRLGLEDVLEQGSEEALQSFISSAGEQLYDKLSDADKVKFGTDAFSAQSFGKYISEGVAGLIGSGPLAVKTAKAKQQELYKAQSNNAYDIVMQGEDAIKAFKTNATNAFEKGEISKEDYDNAIVKIDAYDSYEKTTKDLTLDNDNKKKLFELSLQKENLKAAIKDAEAKDTEGHSRLDKMNPAELGLHNAKVKQAKALQDEIDLIVTKSEVLQQPEVAEKVVDKVVKSEEKSTEGMKPKEGVSSEIGAILGRQYKVKAPVSGEVAVPGKAAYEVPKKVVEEKRKMKDIPVEEWNDPKFDVTIKQHKLADALNEIPEKTAFGTLQQDNLIEKKKDGKTRIIQTFNVTLPNGKTARTASSMVRFPEEGGVGGFMGNFYEENLTNRKNVIGQKVGVTVRTLKDSGRKVIFLWNADEGSKFGKHLAMVKERLRGKSDYSLADQEEMADLRVINMGQNPNAPAPGIIKPEGPVEGGPKASIPFTITTDMRRQLADLGYKKADVQSMKPEEANDIIKSQRTKPKPKTELKEVEVKEKKAAAKKEKDIANLKEEKQKELDLKVNRSITNDLIEKVLPEFDYNPKDYLEKGEYNLEKISEVFDEIESKINAKYDEKIKALEKETTPIMETKPTEEKGKVKVKKEGIGSENYKQGKNQFTGRSTSKVIPNGEKIKGTYKLVDASDVLASHNEKNFAQTDNFPKREDGSTLNDRDYQKDKNAQNEVIRIANKFDDRALSNIPTVTQDGIVVDGNNRTMSRKLAAENKTDLGYKEALKEKLDMYGFTEKQFNSLKNPFLIFEMEGDVDYTTELFSKFNVAEKKEKSPIDKAVEISKTIDERSKRLISDLYADVSTPSEVTSNPVKVRQAIKLLQDLGMLQPNEIPRYFDITKSTTTRDGVSLLESIVLGSSLTESAIRSLDVEGMGKIKTQLLSSIAQLTKNSSLGKDSLKDEISKVIDLINNLKGLGLTLDEYISQPDIFGEKQPVSVNDYAVAVAVSQPGFKKWLADYNNRVGKMDMFKGDVVTKKEILEETIEQKTGKTAESIKGIERLQKAKVKPATLNKFEQSVDLFYQTKDADGAAKKRSLAAKRREFLEKNPTIKYIDDNMKYIYKQLEEQNIIERKGECP